MPREEAAPDDVAISNLADFIGQMLPESVGSMAPEDQVSLVKCMINLWRGTQAPQPPPAVLAPSKPECKAKAVPVSAPVPSERPPGLARTLSECSTPASLEETSDLILADTVHGAICQLLQLSECGLLADGSLDGTVVEYMCGEFGWPVCV